MARKTILIDDLDGSELPDNTRPVRVSIDRKAWNIYLSEDNLGKLYEALDPFTTNAESDNAPAPAAAATSKVDKERVKAVRAWAQATGVTQPNGKPLGDRGRIPDEIYKAYDESH